MKVIDLLNKIANDEEVPTYVRYINFVKNKEDIMMVCKENIIYKLDQLEIHLNDEVEIIEEPQEHKIPEKLPYYSLKKIQKAKNKDEWREERISLLEKRIDDYHIKINEILYYLEKIEYVKQLKGGVKDE